jgi:hypothetical protein
LKSILHIAVPLLVGFSASTPVLAQEVDAYFGLGTVHASSNGQQIDTFGDGTLHPTPGIGGVVTNFGANFFFSRQVGVGWTGAWKFSSADYAGLQYNASFQTFDGIYQPAQIRTKRFAPELRAGLGWANVQFESPDQPSCDQVPGCPGAHFLVVHGAGAARLYVTDHVFLRPAVDVNFVHDFFPFGSHWVPRFSMSVGYSFGRE